jgi:hypothetical protein
MNPLLAKLLHRYMAPAGEGTDGGGGGGVDRGDDFPGADDDKDSDKGGKGAEDQAARDEAAAAKVAEDKAAADKKAAGDKGEEHRSDEEIDADDALSDEEKVAEKAAAAAVKPKNKDTRIPLARHKELLAKEREQREALEKQLAKFQGGQQVADTNEQIGKDEAKLVELEAEYARLVVDGDHAKAAAKMGEIRKLERGIVEAKGAMATQAAEARAYERVRYDTTCDRLEKAYPVLDKDHDDYDKDKEAEVVDLMQAYRVRGMTPSDALQKAARTILGAETKKQEDATTVKPKVDEDAAAKALAAERKAAQVKKNIDASGKQPPASKNVGVDSDKAGGALDAEAAIRMPYDKFVKLDEETLSRLRGDTI